MVGFLEMVTVAERKSQQVTVWGQEETRSGGPATEPAGYLREKEDRSIMAGMEGKLVVQAEVRRQRAGPRSCREPGRSVILLGRLTLKIAF